VNLNYLVPLVSRSLHTSSLTPSHHVLLIRGSDGGVKMRSGWKLHSMRRDWVTVLWSAGPVCLSCCQPVWTRLQCQTHHWSLERTLSSTIPTDSGRSLTVAVSVQKSSASRSLLQFCLWLYYHCCLERCCENVHYGLAVKLLLSAWYVC